MLMGESLNRNFLEIAQNFSCDSQVIIFGHFDKGNHQQLTRGNQTQFRVKMKTCFVTFLFISHVYVSYQKPLNRRPKGKQITRNNILEPEVNLQIQQNYLENKINTLILESLIIDTLIKNQDSSRNRRSLRSRRNLRRQPSNTLDGQAEDYILQLNRKQYRRRGNRGDLVPFPRVG